MRAPITVCALLIAVGCLDAKENALFSATAPASNGGRGATTGLPDGVDSGTGSHSGSSGSPAGGLDAGGHVTAGSSGVAGDLPLPMTTGGAGGEGLGGMAGQGSVPLIDDCSLVEGAVTSPLDGHCYRVNYQSLDFAAAREGCRIAGGHLVSIGSAEENDYVAELHDGEHWLGATDGRADMMAGPGPYEWVSGEGWTYSDWEDGQPNAYETDCPAGSDDASDCFEHCAFQTDEGDWNDRSCWHTIVSVCEWDVQPPPGSSGAPAR